VLSWVFRATGSSGKNSLSKSTSPSIEASPDEAFDLLGPVATEAFPVVRRMPVSMPIDHKPPWNTPADVKVPSVASTPPTNAASPTGVRPVPRTCPRNMLPNAAGSVSADLSTLTTVRSARMAKSPTALPNRLILLSRLPLPVAVPSDKAACNFSWLCTEGLLMALRIAAAMT